MSTIAGTLILKLDTEKTETKSGIWLPPSLVVENNMGTVLHVGIAKDGMEPEVSPGDTVVFNYKSFRKTEFSLDDQDVVEIGFQDVLLIQRKKWDTVATAEQN